MRTLIIGGSGNLSGEVVACLLRRGDDVTVLTRGHRPVPDGCRALKVDRRDRTAMHQALRTGAPDVIINFIGYDIPELQIDLEVFHERIQQYIFISSATVYAKPHRRLPLREDAPLGNAFSEYAQKKLACEEWLRGRQQAVDFPVTIVRPSHTYSAQWIPNAVHSAGFTFAARLLDRRPVFVHDDGEGLWTLTAAADFAVGLVGLAGLDAAVGEVYHITSDEVQTWGKIYAEIAEAFGVDSPDIVKIPSDFICASRPDLVPKLKGDKREPGVFDNAKIKAAVPEFVCRTPFRDGIRASRDWFMADASRRTSDPEADAIFDQVVRDWRQTRR